MELRRETMEIMYILIAIAIPQLVAGALIWCTKNRDGNLWVVVIVKSWVNKQASSRSFWLHKIEQPIRVQISKLTQILTMTQTHKFLLQSSSHLHLCGAGR